MSRLSVLSIALFLSSYVGAQTTINGVPNQQTPTVAATTVVGDVSTSAATATGGTNSRTLAARAADVFNCADYGAVCDGSTNDNTAINACIAAAANSTAYQNNNAVTITWPSGATQNGCVINSLNFTIFQKGTGANLRPRVHVKDATFLCTGTGNVCFDEIGSDLIKIDNVSIRGDSAPNSPEIGIQLGQISGVSAAWNSLDHVNVSSEFTLAAYYNAQSESNVITDSMFSNSHTTSGPIQSLGSVAGGSSYTSGTYYNVPLTGGSGSGALATIVVSGGAVTTVTLTYQGRDYVGSTDTLSASAANIGGTGSGFSVPVATAAPYACVFDAQNYWRPASAFQTITLTPNTWGSETLVSLIGSHCRSLGTGNPSAVWVSWGAGLHFYNSYVLNNNGNALVTLFDNGVTKTGPPGPNWGLNLDFNGEGTNNYTFWLTGSNVTPTPYGLKYRGYSQSSLGLLGTDSNITSASLKDADVDWLFNGTNSSTPFFGSAKLWSVTGRIAAPTVAIWNAPQSYQGQLFLGGLTNAAGIGQLGPVDIMGSAAWAYSCARRLSQAYTGPLCQVYNGTTNEDLYANTNGDLDATGFQAFCNAVTCSVSIEYDQSGNGNNRTQSTVLSQPQLVRSVSALNGRAALLFADQGAQAMTTTAATAINNVFASGGYISAVVDQTGNANQADRILYKTSGSGTGWDWRCGFVGTSNIFSQLASTTAGIWQTGTLPTNQARIMDLQYSSVLTTNVPIIGSQGTNQTLTATQPVGTQTGDASFNLLLGNNAATAGTRGFPGYIAEDMGWATTPSALQLEAIRRNQAAYYGATGVN